MFLHWSFATAISSMFCTYNLTNPLTIKKKNRLANARAGLQYTCFLHDQQWAHSIEYQLHWATLIPWPFSGAKIGSQLIYGKKNSKPGFFFFRLWGDSKLLLNNNIKGGGEYKHIIWNKNNNNNKRYRKKKTCKKIAYNSMLANWGKM